LPAGDGGGSARTLKGGDFWRERGMTGKFLRDTILLILILGLAGCAGSSANPQATPTLEGTQPVDRLFSDLYRSVGGSIGPAISPVFERGNASCQYTLNALMCYDASLAENERFYLPPLAEELGLAWPEVPTATSELAIEGAPTLPEFYAYYYNNLFGIRFGGMPVSDVIYDYQQQRVEQYFQNIVLARNFTDPIDAVSLLPLGQYDCRQNHPSLCPSRPELQQEVADLVGYIDVPYRSMLNLPADAFAFGRVLTRPYLTADGMMQQIWENVVFTWPPEHPEQAHLIQLAYLMRMPGTQLGPQLYDMTQGIIFYPVGNGLGFHLPVVFDEFRAMHGGQDLSGPPIGDYMATADGKNIQQCFENYCLMYDRTPGLPGSRNCGAAAANAPIIGFCDDDDLWLADKARRQLVLLDETGADVCCSGMEILVDGRAVERRGLEDGVLRYADLLRSRRTEANMVTALVRRDAFWGDIGPMDEHIPGGYAEDYEFMLRAARHAPVPVVADPLVQVRWIVQSHFRQQWHHWEEALAYVIDANPDFAREPRGRARIEGQIAVAVAAQGRRREGARQALRTARWSWREPRAYLALAVAAGVPVSWIGTALNKRGRGL